MLARTLVVDRSHSVPGPERKHIGVLVQLHILDIRSGFSPSALQSRIDLITATTAGQI